MIRAAYVSGRLIAEKFDLAIFLRAHFRDSKLVLATSQDS